MKYHFDCVFYYVTDMQKTVDFYSDILGFKFVSQDVVARFDIDGVLFELVPVSSRTELQGSGNARLCLKDGNIRQALEELQKKTFTQVKFMMLTTGCWHHLKIRMEMKYIFGNTGFDRLNGSRIFCLVPFLQPGIPLSLLITPALAGSTSAEDPESVVRHACCQK